MDPRWEATVLLADVRADAARLYAAAGAARALPAVKECLETMVHVAAARGGQIIRAVGDELLALFPTAGLAADAAAAMQAAVDKLPIIESVKLGIRVAFHSGPVTVSQGDVLGNTVTLTARLLEQAASQQIVTTPDTAAGLDNGYKKRLRPLPRSGERDEITTCEFVWQSDGETRKLGASRRGKHHLRLKYGPIELSTAKLNLASIRVGRDLACDLSVLHDLASRHHCTIVRSGDAFVLRDHSTNGTFVTEEGDAEVRVQQTEIVLRRHGWVSLGQPRAATDQVVEYFGE